MLWCTHWCMVSSLSDRIFTFSADLMSLTQLVDVLLGRWKLLLACMLLFGVSALLISAVLPKRYAATATVLIDTRGADPLAPTASDRSQAANQAAVATQLDLIASDRVARRVVDLLDLENLKVFQDQWSQASKGQGDFRTFIASKLVDDLSVKSARDSSIVLIRYVGSDAELATRIANSFAEATIATNLELKVEPARQYAGWFEDRIKSLRSILEKAQQRLAEHQRETRMMPIGSANQIDIENAKLAQLTNQLLEIQALRAESTSATNSSARRRSDFTRCSGK